MLALRDTEYFTLEQFYVKERLHSDRDNNVTNFHTSTLSRFEIIIYFVTLRFFFASVYVCLILSYVHRKQNYSGGHVLTQVHLFGTIFRPMSGTQII